MNQGWPVEHNKARRRFEVPLDGGRGVLNYELRGGAMVITHTGVPPKWEGQGIAASLTRAAFEYARERGLSVVPLCSYAAAYLRRHPEYSDLSDSV